MVRHESGDVGIVKIEFMNKAGDPAETRLPAPEARASRSVDPPRFIYRTIYSQHSNPGDRVKSVENCAV